MKVLITGISGYVGRQLVSGLSEHELFGTYRSTKPNLSNVSLLQGDLRDVSFVAQCIAEVDVVIHAAALTRGTDPQELAEHNENVVRNILDSLGDRSLVFLSSDQAAGPIGAYGQSKRNCEQLIQKYGKSFAILRLTAVLGNYDPKSTFSKIIGQVASKPFIALPAGGRFPIAPVWVEDIASALNKLIQQPMQNKIYGLTGEATTLFEVVQSVEHRLNVRRLKISVPLWPLKIVAKVLKRFSIARRLPLDSILNIGEPVPINMSAILNHKPTPMENVIKSIRGIPAENNSVNS